MKPVKTFFIVDDDPDDQELFIEALRDIDTSCNCLTAFDGEEALQKLTDGLPTPDFIFLDLNMPKMNGKQCLAEIKKNNKLQHIPVVIYSTSAEKRDVEETTELGAAFFLKKPNRFDDLHKALAKIITGGEE